MMYCTNDWYSCGLPQEHPLRLLLRHSHAPRSRNLFWLQSFGDQSLAYRSPCASWLDFCRSCPLRFSFFQRGSLFQPSINHRASSNFCICVRSENCSLFRQSNAWRINSHAPLVSRDPYPDCVVYASMLHEVTLDQNYWFRGCDADHKIQHHF